MPARPKLPDIGVLAQLRRKHVRDDAHPGRCSAGHTLAEIGQIYGVTENGVYLRLRNAGLTTPRPRYAEVLPWVVAVEHTQANEAHMLRALAKRQAGKPEGQRGGTWLDAWLADLDFAGEVIAYDHEQGFYRVKRKPSDGAGYIRQPKASRTRTATV